MMKSQHLALYVLAGAILVVGAMAFGVQTSSLWGLAFLAVCPLMMIFMMRGMHGGADDAGRSKGAEHKAEVRRP
jgi:hypothetical protein